MPEKTEVRLASLESPAAHLHPENGGLTSQGKLRDDRF